MPRRKDAKVTIDGRFSRMLKDDDFAQKASVDRYGRKLAKDAGKEDIKRYYRMESDDEDDEETAAAKLRYDPARGEGVISSEESSDESDDDDDAADEAAEAIAREQLEAANNIPTGEVTSRLAAVNLDWDNVGATDLMKAFSSFAPSGGKVLRVTIYPSEFGRERMERENVEGPPSDIFKPRDQPAIDSDIDSDIDIDDDDAEITAKDLIKEDSGQEFDSGRLRNYQLERLRYFYAVVECDAAGTAHHIYDQCDGAEYEATANFFDLRFIPDDTSFEHDPAHDVCTSVPQNYKPNDFVTDALQHSKVKLTWDEDDPQRKQASKRAFSQREVEDMDLQAYLASDTESEGEDAAAKYRALLAGVSMGRRKPDSQPGDMEVTFTAGLSEKDKGAPVIEDDNDDDDVLESTIDKYARKERERKLRRKEKARLAKGLPPLAKGLAAPTEPEDPLPEEPAAAVTDLGFADPFFADAPSSVAAAAKKDKKRKDKETKAALAVAQASQRAELELLMADDHSTAAAGLRHFDMKQVVKSEKTKKHKKAKKQSREAAEAMEEGAQSGFEIDVKDPRFAAVYEKHEFAIDPTNPRFTKTSAMKKMMDERRKRTQRSKGDGAEEEDGGGRKKKVKVRDEGKAASEEVRRLVQSIKSKSSKR